MDIFSYRDRLITDYARFVRSFIEIRDDRIRSEVEREIRAGLLWPEPLIQLNPAFDSAETISELAGSGVLHGECERIFRLNKGRSEEHRPLRLHRHQAEAIQTARSGASYVLTTGTGSGKSLAYIVPIVDMVLREGPGRGVKAIIVYPMNALANSQANELHKFINLGYPDEKGPVRYARYTGQETEGTRQEIIANPPDILLTNYVMLELMLTRPRERQLIESASGLRFLVLDELHTYRGRQGADVAMLVRRVRDRLAGGDLQCVGTSATMASDGSYRERQGVVAEVATRLFGTAILPDNVIGETLTRVTPERAAGDETFVRELTALVGDSGFEVPTTYDAFCASPLASWVETAFGVRKESGSDRLERNPPRTLTDAAAELAGLTGLDPVSCSKAIQKVLLGGYRCEPEPATGSRPFAFRLHQFISRGDTVFATLEPESERYVTVRGQQFRPGDRNKVLLPMCFCRSCGQEYYTVRRGTEESGRNVFTPRELSDQFHDDEAGEAGFLYLSSDRPWPSNANDQANRVPEEWLEDHGGLLRVKKSQRKNLPKIHRIHPGGLESADAQEVWFLSTPFRFCLRCGVSYAATQRSDFSKLGTLGSEGRSTATTVLSLAAIRHLRAEAELEERARKLLSFTDNRQDAALQAGHFNDFVEIGLLRSALYRAVRDAGPGGLNHADLAQRVFDALALPVEEYAADPDVQFLALDNTRKALRNVLGYRLYRDLQRGWRITAPNLEQCGLLRIEYESLDALCASEEHWQDGHTALVTASPADRQQVAEVLLDYLRRELAIDVDYLESGFQERIEQQSSQHLSRNSIWSLDDGEKLETSRMVFPRSRRPPDFGGHLFLSERGGFGQFLNRTTTFPAFSGNLTLAERAEIIRQLLDRLRLAGLVREAQPADGNDPPGYQLPASALRWIASDGSRAHHDLIRVPTASEEGYPVNDFFVAYYTKVAEGLAGYEAHEHTAQVRSEERERREDEFRSGALPILYCSPTMELGVDIAQLNVVNMRNVPPTPANYAQRSGRAGRSGQPALVFTYCSGGSSHDQYFFRKPNLMVAGSVAAPRLDLANEDLVRAHIQAVWLAESGLDLKKTLADVLDVSGDWPSLEPLPNVEAALESASARARAKEGNRRILDGLSQELEDADWYSDGWLDEAILQIPTHFERACARWRTLYRSALSQSNEQQRVITDASRPYREKQHAKRLRNEAEQQLSLLIDIDSVRESDFYSYRYFASEGFLPGYSFPRLPLSAYIPGRRTSNPDHYLSRPRFLAISEFGPKAIIYHEGSRYVVNRVIMPVGEDEPLTRGAKVCDACGYLHPVEGATGADLCEACGEELPPAMNSLFRLQNVSTRRRERINSDEEERRRMGFELRTAFRFVRRGGGPGVRRGSIDGESGTFFELAYGPSARIWRVNLGWRRRRNRHQLGFLLDTEKGYWARNELMDDDPEDPMSARVSRVVPFVEDFKNSLLVDPKIPLSTAQRLSFMTALKNAMQLEFQLEDMELAAEALPGLDTPTLMLFYESSEGGAGVLRRMVEEVDSWQRVVRRALEVCHFDPETGADLGGPTPDLPCEAACYDCLLSYRNQLIHSELDRKGIRDLLMDLRSSRLAVSPTHETRAEHLERLRRLSDSDLERAWLGLLEERDLHLPTHAQHLIEECDTRVDFLYASSKTVIYIDGRHHDAPDVTERDRAQTDALENVGYTVIRFRYDAQAGWSDRLAAFPSTFGTT